MAGDVRVYSSVPSVDLFVEMGPPMPGASPIVIDDTTRTLYAYLSSEVTQVGGGSALPTLAAVATSGAYGDLSGTPSITTVSYGVVTAGDLNFTGITNITNIQGKDGFYSQVGNIVTLSGGYNVRTTTLTVARIRLTPPVSTSFTTTVQAAGVASPTDLNENSAGAFSETTTESIDFKWNARVSASSNNQFILSYQVL